MFEIKRKPGHIAGRFVRNIDIKDNTCGCGKVIKAGKLRIQFVGDSYPVNICPTCVRKLIKFLKG